MNGLEKSIIFSVSILILLALFCAAKKKVKFEEPIQTQTTLTNNESSLNNQTIFPTDPFIVDIIIQGPNSLSDSKEFNFPITLATINKVTARGDYELKFVNQSTIQANSPIPHNKAKSYFKIKILRSDPISELKIGVANKASEKGELSVGKFLTIKDEYHLLINDNRIPQGRQYQTGEGDLIGCLYQQDSNPKISFIKNGTIICSLGLGESFVPMFPTLIATEGFEIEYNFGTHPFRYQKANTKLYGLADPSTVPEVPPIYIEPPNF